MGQLLIAVAGFVLIIGWFGLVALNTYKLLVNDAEPKPAAWLGLAGGATFFVSWLWAWVTSFQILRAAKESEPAQEPPRLS